VAWHRPKRSGNCSHAWGSAGDLPRVGTNAVCQWRAHPSGHRKRLASARTDQLAQVLDLLEGHPCRVQREPVRRQGNLVADLIVLAGAAGNPRKLQKDAGHDRDCALAPGRAMLALTSTEVDSVPMIEPVTDGFPQLLPRPLIRSPRQSCWLIVPQLLTLTAP